MKRVVLIAPILFAVAVSVIMMPVNAPSLEVVFKETPVCTNTARQDYPAIYGDRIVWTDDRNGNADIYMYDLSTKTETQITTNTATQSGPDIYDDYIVWTDYRNGNGDIYMYDLSTSTEIQICVDSAGQVGPSVYGNRIVWADERSGNRDIYMYDLSTSTETSICTASDNQYAPEIYGDIIVWYDYRHQSTTKWNNAEIYMYNLSTSTETRVTTNDEPQRGPDVYGDHIVWTDERNGNGDIYMYDISTSTESSVCTGSADQSGPAIYGDKIVWKDTRNGGYDIYMYDLSTSTETRVTADPTATCEDPAIWGNRIVWQDERNAAGNGDIYLAEVVLVEGVYVDIRPGTWPNAINVKSKGVLPVAICGTEDFDVTTIDPATVRLHIEGVEDGVAPLRWSIKDVATPYLGEPGGGHAIGSDGIPDLMLQFNTQEAVNKLLLANHKGETMPLIIKGNLLEAYDGTIINGQDYVQILG